jgi:glycosyltransferase involved in cell wall biosynthesis
VYAMERRIFILSYRKCAGPVGGPGGVNYKLFLANKNYNLLKNTHYVFEDIILTDESDINSSKNLNGDSKRNEKPASFLKAGKSALKNILQNTSLSEYLGYENKLIKMKKFMLQLNEKYSFKKEDVFIFHDVESAYIFNKLFNYKNTLLVYHQQGGLYYEWQAFSGKENNLLNCKMQAVTKETFEKTSYIGFPSDGAYEAFINTSMSEDTNKIVERKKYYKFYNGFDRTEVSDKDTSSEILSVAQNIKKYKLSFITISALNEAKGVEQIPQYLAKIKEEHGDLIWVIVGDGVKAKELQNNIEKFKLTQNVIWIRQKVSHDDLLFLLNNTNYYIMFHRKSIFDFATIEAMAYGNIPILSNIGGNKEVILGNNGILLNSYTDTSSFDAKLINELDLLKQENMKIATTHFSTYKFLKVYAEFIEEKFK